MTIRVIKAGALSTLQDLGRYGYQRYGVIVDGVMDEWSHRVANRLVGNRESEATLEITLVGPSLAFDRAAVIAICGADLSPRIGERDVPLWRAIRVQAGSVLEFGRRRSGCRAYLAVRGGYDVAPVMGSKSTYLRGGFGGFEGRALRKGDVLAIGQNDIDGRNDTDAVGPTPMGDEVPLDTLTAPAIAGPGPAGDEISIRAVTGPQWSLFSEEAQHAFTTEKFTLTPNSDRMGYRLEGAKLATREPIEMISEGVSFGTIQVPPDGNPIILMADHQTTGGYPKIAQAAGVDLPRLAQMMPGQAMRFELISLDVAQRLYLERARELERVRTATARLLSEA